MKNLIIFRTTELWSTWSVLFSFNQFLFAEVICFRLHGMSRIYFKMWNVWAHGWLNWYQTCPPSICRSHHRGRSWECHNTQISPLMANFQCQRFPATSLGPAAPLVVYPTILLLACREPGMLIMVYPYQISTSISCSQVCFQLVSRHLIMLLQHPLEPQTTQCFKNLAWVRMFLAC